MPASTPIPVLPRRTLLLAILVGGLVAGTFDFISAVHTFGWGMPRGIAAGLLGTKAFPQAGGGTGAWILGVILHFTIAFLNAATYCLASQWLTFLRRHLVFGAISFGIGSWIVMNTLVIPLSAFPAPPAKYSAHGLLISFGYQIVLIGLPIAVSLWAFARRAARSQTPT